MANEVIAKKWGSSIGIVLPKELVDKQMIRENDKIIIEVVKEADLTKLFGSLKKKKMSGQEFKDMVREGWN